MKTKTIISTILGLSLLYGLLPAQTEEFRFKLYMESLANGKKDTLELGVGPDGLVGCVYDSTLCPVYADPFFDTAHVGAFIVDREWGTWENKEFDTIRVDCPMYVKKRVGIHGRDMVIVFPLSACPIRFSWNQSLLGYGNVKSPMFTNWFSGRRYDVGQGHHWRPFYLDMSKDSSFELTTFENPGSATYDSLVYLTYIRDSSGQEHAYVHVFVCLGERFVKNEEPKRMESVRISPNPVRHQLRLESVVPLTSWRIYTTYGQLLREGMESTETINCENLPQGLYILDCEDAQGGRCFVRFIRI